MAPPLRRLLLGCSLCGLLAAGAAAGARPPASPLRLVPVVSGLREPLYLTAPRSELDRLYIVEKRGVIRVAVRGRLRPNPFLDIRSRVRTTQLLGLFSVAFHPAYARNRRFFVHYSGRNGNVYVVEFRSSGGHALLQTARVVFRAKTSPHPLAHVGGQLAFGPDGHLYVGLGDGLIPEAAQDLASPLGKIIRLDVDRPDQPFEVVAYGLRNPWRFSFDRQNGDLYVGDVGDLHWEEVDYLSARNAVVPNFGWSAFEGRRRISEAPLTAPEALTFPLAAYRHPKRGCSSMIGGYVYRGRRLAHERGRYFYGDLCTGTVRSLRVVGGKARAVRREAFVVPELLASFGEDARGELYA
ncbi:MAG: PQQ-dependent sugar dehydrogenase, partial [Actinomycetota bacterium]|nr:PQQ-dependent sugar dehydrogenase [Actinomycetota bacterium]